MIRTTRSSLLSNISLQLAASSKRLSVAEEQATTGLKLNRPSDAPASVREAESMHAAIADQGVWKANADSAVGVLDTMDSALGQASDLLVRARELAVGAASETMSTEGRAAAATEVAAILESMRAAGKKVIEPTQQADDGWVEHHDAVANATLVPRTKSWYMGTNVAGKQRSLIVYAGGVGPYREKCNEVAAKGYEGMAIS